MAAITERARRVMSGLIAVLLFVAAVLVGTKIAYGATQPVYHLTGTFSAAGQGMLPGSDVKIHGVNIGKVASIKLINGRARIRLTIKKSETVPTASRAVIRPKTLFGEKFVDIDPGPTEASGPFLHDGGVIKDTLGGFELERILSEVYPVLKEIKPDELSTILDNLSRGGEGTGPDINDAFHNLSVFATGQAKNAKLTEKFIDDLAALSQTLADHADEAIAGARDAHAALPEINARSDEFTSVLKNTARLTGDLADVLEANRPLLNKIVPEGGRVLNALDAQKGQLPGVVTGLRQFFETLAEAGTGIPYGDTNLAKIKLLIGSDCTQLLMDCSGDVAPGAENLSLGGPKAPLVPGLLGGLRAPTKGIRALQDIVAGVVG